MKIQVFTALIHREEDLFVSECAEVGTVSQGITIDDTIENLREATELYREEFRIPERNSSFITTFELVHA